MFLRASVLALSASLAALPALAARQSEILFSHKHWQVELVGWDDGSLACVANVSAPGEVFALWTFPDSSLQLQFYSTAWNFTEGERADLQVQIDKKAPWNLTDAELSQNSVLFTLPNSDSAVDFIQEVAVGNRLFLRDKDGADVQDYSLAGSRASIDALIECGDVLTEQGGAANPFN